MWVTIDPLSLKIRVFLFYERPNTCKSQLLNKGDSLAFAHVPFSFFYLGWGWAKLDLFFYLCRCCFCWCKFLRNLRFILFETTENLSMRLRSTQNLFKGIVFVANFKTVNTLKLLNYSQHIFVCIIEMLDMHELVDLHALLQTHVMLINIEMLWDRNCLTYML